MTKQAAAEDTAETLKKALQEQAPRFVRDLIRARYLWHKYPRLLITESLPKWAADYEPKYERNETTGETLLIQAGILQVPEKVDFDRDEDKGLGAIQIMRREVPWGDSTWDERNRRWVDQLPEILDLMSWSEVGDMVCAAAILESDRGDRTPFKHFIQRVLSSAMTRPVTYNDVYEKLTSDEDGNMLEDWQALTRTERRIKVDFPEGVEEAKEKK